MAMTAFSDHRSPGSHSIVSTMREDQSIVACFVAHHLQAEVDEIFLFLDAPDPETEAMLATTPRVRVTICTDAYWQTTPLGHRPDAVVRRQLLNAEQARKWMRSDWLIHIDSDEFLVSENSLRQELADLPMNVDLVRIRNLERVFPQDFTPTHVFQGMFRDQISGEPAEVEKVYGSSAMYLHNGLSGYSRGKTAMRSNSVRRPRLHPPRQQAKDEPTAHVCASTRLLHFDGFTPLHWVAKLLRRIDTNMTRGNTGRKNQIGYLKNATTVDQQRDLFQQLMTLDHDRQRKLTEAGLLLTTDFNPLPAVGSVFPEYGFDVSPSSIDRRIVASNPERFKALNLSL